MKSEKHCGSHPDYDLVIDRLHLYFDMQLVTFGIDKDKNLILSRFLIILNKSCSKLIFSGTEQLL